MAYRFILNETSYHGHGAVNEIVAEVKSRGFKKALIVTDADLMKFGVVKKVTDILDRNDFAYESSIRLRLIRAWRLYRQE